jgi:hypothetical protein
MIVVVVSKPFGTRISLGGTRISLGGKRKERERDNKKKQKRSNQIVCTILTRFLSLSNYPPAAATCVFQFNKTFVMVLDSP